MIVTIFRSRLNSENQAEYNQWADRISALAATMPGYISHKGFLAEDGERVTIVEFEHEAGMHAWATHPGHMAAKQKGRAGFYTEYRIQVCNVVSERVFP